MQRDIVNESLESCSLFCSSHSPMPSNEKTDYIWRRLTFTSRRDSALAYIKLSTRLYNQPLRTSPCYGALGRSRRFYGAVQDFSSEPTSAPEIVACTRLPNNQLQASDSGIGVKEYDPKPIEIPVARPNSTPYVTPDTTDFFAIRNPHIAVKQAANISVTTYIIDILISSMEHHKSAVAS